jgi:hypothetical protein
MRRGFIWIWGLVTLLLAGLVGAAAYAAGVATHVATVAAPDGAPYPYYAYPHFFGFGFIFPLLFILLILFFVFRPRRWYGGGWGPGGHGGGYGGGGHYLEQRLEEWHKKAHGETTDKPS